MPGFLSEIAALQREFPQCRAQATNYVFNSNGVKSPTILRKIPFSGERGVLTNYFEVASCSHPPVCSICVCIERALLQEIGGFPVGIKSGEDLLTWARVAVKTDWAYSMRAMAQYNFDQVYVKEKPKRMHDAGDYIGESLIELKSNNMEKGAELSLYISHWYKMRTSVFMRVGQIKETWRYGLKALKFNRYNYKVCVMMALILLPYSIRRRIV
jgi:hypothetical protein